MNPPASPKVKCYIFGDPFQGEGDRKKRQNEEGDGEEDEEGEGIEGTKSHPDC